MPPVHWAFTIITVLFIIAIAMFLHWRRDAYRRAIRNGRLAQTALGPVEYAVEGSGPVVMVLHGGMGGIDQGLLLGRLIGIPDSFTMLCPSRAGYLRTPLTTCRTPAETADALAALLDSLGHHRVAVVGISGGGPTALQFVIRHPERVSALLMLAAISRKHEQPARTRKVFGWLIFSSTAMWLIDFASWLMWMGVFRWRPSLLVRPLFKATESLDDAALNKRVAQVKRNPRQIKWLKEFFALHMPISHRKMGLDNDLAQFTALPDYPVERIACPTLVVHGRHDGNVPFEHAEFVARGVPGAELRAIEGCGHMYMLSTKADEVNMWVMDFLHRHADAA